MTESNGRERTLRAPTPFAAGRRSEAFSMHRRRAAARPAGYVAVVNGKPGHYHVVVPDLPSVAVEGDTMEAALANAAGAVRQVCAETLARGELLPEPRSAEDAVHADPEMQRRIGVDSALALVPVLPEEPDRAMLDVELDADLVAAVDAAAAAAGVARADYVAAALEAALARALLPE